MNTPTMINPMPLWYSKSGTRVVTKLFDTSKSITRNPDSLYGG